MLRPETDCHPGLPLPRPPQGAPNPVTSTSALSPPTPFLFPLQQLHAATGPQDAHTGSLSLQTLLGSQEVLVLGPDATGRFSGVWPPPASLPPVGRPCLSCWVQRHRASSSPGPPLAAPCLSTEPSSLLINPPLASSQVLAPLGKPSPALTPGESSCQGLLWHLRVFW